MKMSDKRTDSDAQKAIESLNRIFSAVLQGFKPPENLTVSEWADKYRSLSPEASAEPGPWRTSRTPYLKEPMDAFTDPKVRHVAMVAASQVGKSEMINNIIGYIIHQDPGSILLVEPNMIDAKKYSKLRISPMIRDSNALRRLVSPAKSRDSSNTILEKSYPGGMLIMCGSTEAHSLASMPMRYVLGDERDRWATSAGREGDPWGLAMARQTTFYNAKSFEVSTPTIKGASAIEKAFYTGTQERWCSLCPHCGGFHNIRWADIRYEYEASEISGKQSFDVQKVYYVCPECGGISSEHEMKRTKAKWIADNPDAYENGTRSFWLNAFCSPWKSWKQIVLEYLQALGDPEKMKVVYNTLFGELWEERGGLEDEESFLARREEYKAELPDGVLVLTAGVDVQDDRLEYEVVGFGLRNESWGIRRGQIMGRPDDPEVWNTLDDILAHVYRYENGKGLRISMTFVDDGGHFTMNTRSNCAARIGKRVFDCKGFAGDGRPFISPPKKVNIMVRGKYIGNCWQYQLGVDAGKQMIMDNLKVQTPGPRYCHFPRNEECGYGHAFFVGLLSEHLVYKEHNKNPWVWEKIPGHERNEPLDCRNYALAALKALSPDMDAILRRTNGNTVNTAEGAKTPVATQNRRTPARQTEQRMNDYFDW
ncbi:MAG: phage terminase large subunit family protein [Aristaeellaceae bacterium]